MARVVEHWKCRCKKPDYEDDEVNRPEAFAMAMQFSFECWFRRLEKAGDEWFFVCLAGLMFAQIVSEVGDSYSAASSKVFHGC